MPGKFPQLPLASRQLNGPRAADEIKSEHRVKTQITTPQGLHIEFTVFDHAADPDAAIAQMFRLCTVAIRDAYPGEPELLIEFVAKLAQSLRDARETETAG